MTSVSATSSARLPVQQRSFDDLGSPLVDVTFCVLDLETTGGNRLTDAITEIGAVKVRGGECLGTFQTLVNPGRAIPPAITVLTGISDAIVTPAPRIGSVLAPLLEFIGDAVIVGHNVAFDVAFLRRALADHDRPDLDHVVVDTVALARRLLRDDAPNMRLGTLAARLRLQHTPSHRALDDAWATVDLLHVLIERASGHGVTGLDDLLGIARMAGHPQAAKLKLTTTLPRSPGVYLFCGAANEVLYVGKATNLRQRVRSYFGSEDRRKIAPMLRETQSVRHIELPDPFTAEIIEHRMIARLLPRYNRRGTTWTRYRYVRLDTDALWPRLSVTARPGPSGLHLGPLPSTAAARRVIDAIESVVPLRRCTTRLGRGHVPATDASPCTAAQLGVAACPCAGAADRATYDEAVTVATAAVLGDPDAVVARLHHKMIVLASQQRFEEAAETRDRATALLAAVRRSVLVAALRSAGTVELRRGGSTWVVVDGILTGAHGTSTQAGRSGQQQLAILPVEPLDVEAVAHDEALVIARFVERHAASIDVECSGPWPFPVDQPDDLASWIDRRSRVIDDDAAQVDREHLHVRPVRCDLVE
jgi:DNA polymerase-3 subunit epsilon